MTVNLKIKMIIDDYLEKEIEYKNKYGENTLILMQVGSFFELYSIECFPNENSTFFFFIFHPFLNAIWRQFHKYGLIFDLMTDARLAIFVDYFFAFFWFVRTLLISIVCQISLIFSKFNSF